MGLETTATVRWKGRSRRATVHLDATHLRVSVTPALRIPLERIRAAAVDAGLLRLDTADGPLAVELGAKAATWLAKIRSPPSRAAKLGLTAGQAVHLRGVDDAALAAELAAAGATVQLAKPSGSLHLVFLGVTAPAGLAQLSTLRKAIRPDGAIWVVRAKGKGAPVPEAAVHAAAKKAGLVDVKVVAFSETHTADKLVIPLARR